MKDLTLRALMTPLVVADKAVGTAGRVADTVLARLPGAKPGSPTTSGNGDAVPAEAPTKVHGDPIAGSDSVPTKEATATKDPAAPKAVKKAPAKKAPAKKAPAKKAPAKKKAAPTPERDHEVDTSKPVNVVEELGLDPAPVAQPAQEPSDTSQSTGAPASDRPPSPS